ncbi:hypothetical protein ACFQZ4_06485 [Catellatospora coxensis]
MTRRSAPVRPRRPTRCQIPSHCDHWPAAGGVRRVLCSRSGISSVNRSPRRACNSCAVKKRMSSPVFGPLR